MICMLNLGTDIMPLPGNNGLLVVPQNETIHEYSDHKLKQEKLHQHFTSLPQKTLFPNRTTNLFDGVKQGQIGECFFDASLISIASTNRRLLESMIRDNQDGTCTVRLYDKNQKACYYKIDKTDLANDSRNSAAYHRHAPWAAIIEKAYTIHQMLQDPSPDKKLINYIDGGHGIDVFAALTGKKTDRASIDLNFDECLDDSLKSKVLQTLLPENKKRMEAEIINANFSAEEIEKIKAQVPPGNMEQNVKPFLEILSKSTDWEEKFDKFMEDELYEVHCQLIQVFAEYAEMGVKDNQAPDISAELISKFKEFTAKLLIPAEEKNRTLKSIVIDDIQKAINSSDFYYLSISEEKIKTEGKTENHAGEKIGGGLVGKHAYAPLQFIMRADKMFLRIANPWQEYSAVVDKEGNVTQRTEALNRRRFSQVLFEEQGASSSVNKQRMTIGYLNPETSYAGVSEIDFDTILKVGSNFETGHCSKTSRFLNDISIAASCLYETLPSQTNLQNKTGRKAIGASKYDPYEELKKELMTIIESLDDPNLSDEEKITKVKSVKLPFDAIDEHSERVKLIHSVNMFLDKLRPVEEANYESTLENSSTNFDTLRGNLNTYVKNFDLSIKENKSTNRLGNLGVSMGAGSVLGLFAALLVANIFLPGIPLLVASVIGLLAGAFSGAAVQGVKTLFNKETPPTLPDIDAQNKVLHDAITEEDNLNPNDLLNCSFGKMNGMLMDLSAIDKEILKKSISNQSTQEDENELVLVEAKEPVIVENSSALEQEIPYEIDHAPRFP
jgi:hypothetical protein